MSTPASNKPRTEAEAAEEAAQIIAAAFAPDSSTPAATNYRDSTPIPAYGTTPPVHQPDRRIVPEWAAGVFVAGTGLGCFAALTGAGIYAATAGIAQLTVWGVAAITAPFIGTSIAAIAIGTVLRRVRAAAPPITHNHYEGNLTQHHQTVQSKSLIARLRITR